MEKINNYTKGDYLRDGNCVYVLQPSGLYASGKELLENRIYFGIQGPCSSEEKEATAKIMQLAPTLYEQHFKMLDTLKFILNDKLPTLLSGESQKLLEQTIKECE